MKKLNIEIERTKKGYAALWESGGGYSNTGKAIIIAGPNGEKKAPIYTRARGHLACAKHALFPVNEGDIVIQSRQHRGDFHHEVYRIVAIRDDEAELERIAEYYRGQWDAGQIGQKLEADLARMTAGEAPAMGLSIAVQAAECKATCYHCRSPHFAKEKEVK